MKITCIFCAHEFTAECGAYGCPNCNGEGLCNHAYDETGRCFECDKPAVPGYEDPLSDWLRYLADTCPEEDKLDLDKEK